MAEGAHWADDRYWTEALETLDRIRKEGRTTLTLDLDAIAKVVYNAR
jgi:hypothetical protein